MCLSCKSRQEFSNEYLLFTIVFSIDLQNLASIQPRTSLSKFGGKFNSLFIRLLNQVAQQKLESCSMDNGKDPELFRQNLLNIAQTTLSSKLLRHEKEHFAELAVNAVLRLKGGANLDYIQVIEKQGGSLKDSFLEEGFILEKRIVAGPKEITNCKVMVANTPMDTDKIKIYGSRVKVDSYEAVGELEKAEKDKMKTKVEKICAHGCNVFINRQPWLFIRPQGGVRGWLAAKL